LEEPDVLVVKLMVIGVWSRELGKGEELTSIILSEFWDLERSTSGSPGIGKSQNANRDMPWGLSPWSCIWSRGVESVSLVLGFMGKHGEGPVDLEIEVPSQNQESRFSSRIKDTDREVMRPLGGIGVCIKK
jgi:hypothetical protein